MSIFGTEIIDLPSAAPLTGSEVIPVVQNGITSKTTISSVGAASIITPQFLVLATSPDLLNERVLGVSGSGLTSVDGGAGGSFTISLAGTVKSLQDNGATGILAKDTTGTVTTRSLQQPAAGFSITNGDGVAGNPTFALSNSLASLQNLSGTGGLYRVGSDTLTLRTITGTANQISITNGDGVSGAPTISIVSNPTIPGTSGLIPPSGTTAQRVDSEGYFRYNTTLKQVEYYNGTTWVGLNDAGIGDGDKGDITVSGSGSIWTIDNQAVTYAKIQNVSATNRFLGRITSGAGSAEELTGTQATTLLDTFTSALKGLAPASGGGTTNFLRADGTWAVPPGGGGSGSVTDVSVVTANGFSGAVATSTTTPAITLATTITGLLKGNGTAISAASAGTDYEVPLTFSTGLTRTVNTITVNTTQNIAKLSNLTTNGFVKTSAGDGTLSVDTGSYQPLDATLTALAAYNTNGIMTQTAADTFTGRTITGTASRISLTNGNGVSGNPTIDIDAAYVGQTSITTLGTITTGVWNGTDIAFANIAQIATDRLLGRDTAGTGDIEQLTVSGGIEFTGAGGIQTSAFTGDATKSAGGTALTLATVNSNVGSFGSATQVSTFTVNAKGLITAASSTSISITSSAVSDFTEAAQDAVGAMVDTTLVYVDATPLLTRAALTGDVTASQGSNATTIANDAVTYAKMQNISATQRLLGRNTAGAGDTEEVTATQALDWLGATQGQILYRGASAWTVLSPGTSGQLLQTNGAAANPSWATVGALTDGDKGDITVSASGATWTIDNSVVTYAKIQNVSATSRLLGRVTAGAGVIEELTDTQARSVLGLGTGSAVTFAGLQIQYLQLRDDLGTGSFNVEVQAGSVLTANRALEIYTGDANRTLTFSSNASIGGTNTGDQNIFQTIAVSGQSNVVADTTSDTLTLVAGTNITITTDAATDSITINASGGGGTPTQITVANEASDTTCFPAFFTAATGDLGPKTNAALTFNSSTASLGCTTFVGALTGNASTATTLQTARTINGTSFNGSADITVAAAAGTLTGATLAAGVTASSLTSVGTLATGVWDATTIAVNRGGTGNTTYTNGQLLIGNTTGNTLTKATLTAPAAGITITNGTGSITFALANDLAAVEGLAANGMAARTGTDAWAVRTITGGGGITVTNGDGVSGNPTLSISNLKTIWYPAGSMTPSISGGCATLATIATSANQPDIQSLDFDPTTAEYAQFSVRFPKSWNEGTITAEFYWSHAATTVNFGVVWGIQAVAVSNNEAIPQAYGTAQTVTDTGGTTNNLYSTPTTSAITIAGTPAAGDLVFFRVYRDATNGSDTMAIDARLLGVSIFYTTDTLTDA